jgi:hypothetical protein
MRASENEHAVETMDGDRYLGILAGTGLRTLSSPMTCLNRPTAASTRDHLL